MTRKDYEIIARSINAQRIIADQAPTSEAQQHERRALWAVATDLSFSLKDDNPRFDRTKFMAACGF